MSLLHLGSTSVKWIRLPKLIRLVSLFILSVFGIVQLQFLGSVEKLKRPWNYAQRPYVDVDIRTKEEHVKDTARDILYIDDVEDEWRSNKRNDMVTTTGILKPAYARLQTHQLKAANTPKAVLHMQRWASENQTFGAEAQRFLEYISNPQIQCENLNSPGMSAVISRGRSQDWAWKVCQDQNYVGHDVNSGSRKCVVYSFGPVIYQGKIEIDLARQGCEVHVFDPSSKTPIRQSPGLDIRTHSVTLDWRESLIKISRPSRPSAKTRQSRKLVSIMQELGHQQVDVIRADLQSSEWKVLENIITDGSIKRVGQIIFTAHLHWSGFEVKGSDPEVIRYWYSVLKSVESAGFKLFNSYKDNNGPKVLLGQNFENSSCCFTLGWVKVDNR